MLFKNESNLFFDCPITVFGLKETETLPLEQFFQVLAFLNKQGPHSKDPIRKGIKPEISPAALNTILFQLRSKGHIETADFVRTRRKSYYRNKPVSAAAYRPIHGITDKGRQLLRQVTELYEFPEPDIVEQPAP